jgi:hypothetical protein
MVAAQRVRQGLRALFAFSTPVDEQLATCYLTPAQITLFQQMRRSDQLHSLNVLRTILAEGSTPADLAVAALLHDVGKARYPLAVWQKTLIVLVQAFIPALYHRWIQGDEDNFWQRPFVVKSRHPVWGADLLVDTDISEQALWLIAHHQDAASHWEKHENADLLKRLQQADESN